MKQAFLAAVIASILIFNAPAAAEIHPDDLAAVNRIHKVNEAEHGLLAASGWRPDTPESWEFTPEPASAEGQRPKGLL